MFLDKASNRFWTITFLSVIFWVLRDEEIQVGRAVHSAWRLQKYQVGIPCSFDGSEIRRSPADTVHPGRLT